MSDFSIYDSTDDLNHDGTNDDVTVHQDESSGNTYMYADTDHDGRVDAVAVDGPDTGDGGAVDAVYYDTDGDGQVDVVDADTDHDGQLDTRYVDDNEDGTADSTDSSPGATDSQPGHDDSTSGAEQPGLNPFAS